MVIKLNDNEYQEFINETKARYHAAQLKAAYSVNEQMIEFYWDLGNRIAHKQSAAKWGSNFLKQVSRDMQIHFPGTKGFSVSNLERMRKFARLYPDLISAQAVRKLPWGHIIVLLETPVSNNENGQRRFFLNGQVLPENNLQKHVDFVQSIRDSLNKNPTKIYLAQKERRAFYMKNTAGFHAREIFEDPIEQNACAIPPLKKRDCASILFKSYKREYFSKR